MSTAIDIVLQAKLRAIADGDYNAQFKSLQLIFEQRKECAKLMLSIYHPTDAKDFIDRCDQEIKKALYL